MATTNTLEEPMSTSEASVSERSKADIDRAAQETAQRRVREVQRRLDLQRQLERMESVEIDLGLG